MMTACPYNAPPVLPVFLPVSTYEREHRIAQSLERILLRTVPHDTFPNLTTEAFYEAVLAEATVGGDSIDAFALAGDRAALAVIDASGKGLAAAERVAEIRFALRAFLCEHSDPGRALWCLNDFVCDAQRLGRHDDSTFATLTLVVLDCASGEMTCLCAGGEPPLVLRMDGTVEVAQICGPALGLRRSQAYSATTLFLGPGDTVLLATDGLTEARRPSLNGPAGSRSGAFLGMEGLAGLAVQAQDVSLSVSQLGQRIFEDIRAFAGGLFHDDACLLIGRREMRRRIPTG